MREVTGDTKIMVGAMSKSYGGASVSDWSVSHRAGSCAQKTLGNFIEFTHFEAASAASKCTLSSSYCNPMEHQSLQTGLCKGVQFYDGGILPCAGYFEVVLRRGVQ